MQEQEQQQCPRPPQGHQDEIEEAETSEDVCSLLLTRLEQESSSVVQE